jgi:hypothetical protein
LAATCVELLPIPCLGEPESTMLLPQKVPIRHQTLKIKLKTFDQNTVIFFFLIKHI